ncbi:MAG: hypothetical protein NTW06_04175, partial [Candidatus Falkowbacteria bacterium]|nr:hypothetical protein [Candidatus Falkowbacteria bacterium]
MEINNKTFGRFSMAPNGVDFIDVSAFVEWKDVTVHCTFEDGNAQSNLSMSEVKFVGQSADLLYAYYEAGRNGTGNGIMQGVPYSITFFNDINSTVVFNGYIDMRDAKFNDSQHIVMATLKKRDNLFKLEDDLGGLTWGYLESIGLVKAADYFDFEYGVQKKINTIELIMLAMSIYSLTTELVKIAKQIVVDIAHVLGHTIGGAPVPTAPASGIIVTIVLILIQIAEMLLMMYALMELMAQLIAQLIPIKRTAKVLNYRKACTIISSYFGYTFESNITDLDKFYYMPSNVTYDSVNLTTGLVEEFLGCQKGIPNTTDYGYNAGQFMTILTNQFNARKAIINGKLCFYNVEDPFWKKNSTYKILPTWDETRSTNANDLVSSIMLSYEVDYSDEH